MPIWRHIEQAIELSRSIGAESSCTKVAGLTITIRGENLTVRNNAGRVLDEVRFDVKTGAIIDHIELPCPNDQDGG
jgi:hypothetical protein